MIHHRPKDFKPSDGKRFPTLEDLDPMPFGQYKGQPLQEVPASYLFFLWIHGMKQESRDTSSSSRRLALANYIWNNLSHLKKEHPDGIWS